MTDDNDATPPPERLYQLSLKGEGLTMERSVPESVALSVVALVMGGDGTRLGVGPRFTSQPAAATGGVASSPDHVSLTVGEYLTEVEAKRNPDKILAFGAYLMDELGRETFTRDEVRSMFQKAAEPVPGNFHRDFTWALRNRWLGEQPGTPGAYYVTKTGRTALSSKFASDVKAASKLGRRRTRKSSSAASAAGGADDVS